MPIYQYKCENCGEQFDVIQKFADQPLAVHEKCGGPVHRMLTAPAFQFKGTGWYVTDYAKKSNAPSAASEGGAESKTDGNAKSDGKSDGKSDTKTETKTESKTESKSDNSSSSTPAPAAAVKTP